jgi:hypothetical protein
VYQNVLPTNNNPQVVSVAPIKMKSSKVQQQQAEAAAAAYQQMPSLQANQSAQQV